METGDLENRLALLRDSYFAKLVAFNNLLNVEANSTVNIPGELWDENIIGERKAILDSIKINNHRLLSNDYEYESFLSKEQAARRTGLPNISIGVDYIFTGKSENPMTDPAESGRNAVLFPKIGVTIPIYRKKYNAMINEAGYLQNVATEAKADNLNKLETLLEKIIKDYNDAKRRYELYERQTVLATQALQLLQSEYSTGETDFAELLRIERKLLNYALELQRARTDKNSAVAFMDYLMGR
jgi:outer membrane protein TolC